MPGMTRGTDALMHMTAGGDFIYKLDVVPPENCEIKRGVFVRRQGDQAGAHDVLWIVCVERHFDACAQVIQPGRLDAAELHWPQLLRQQRRQAAADGRCAAHCTCHKLCSNAVFAQASCLQDVRIQQRTVQSDGMLMSSDGRYDILSSNRLAWSGGCRPNTVLSRARYIISLDMRSSEAERNDMSEFHGKPAGDQFFALRSKESRV